MKFLINISLILIFCGSSNLLCAQSPISQDAQAARIKMKGVYIYQFARRVYWPEKYTKGDFNIGIYGNKDIFDQLSSSYTDKLVGSQAIKFKFFNNPSEIEDCHLLYVINESRDMPKICIGFLIWTSQHNSINVSFCLNVVSSLILFQ